MSDVASLSLCKELYELSGWDKVDYWHLNYMDGGWHIASSESLAKMPPVAASYQSAPAYSLGYLLRKLPRIVERKVLLVAVATATTWGACYEAYDLKEKRTISIHNVYADTPEDATTKLCIELFKQGILK